MCHPCLGLRSWVIQATEGCELTSGVPAELEPLWQLRTHQRRKCLTQVSKVDSFFNDKKKHLFQLDLDVNTCYDAKYGITDQDRKKEHENRNSKSWIKRWRTTTSTERRTTGYWAKGNILKGPKIHLH